MASSVLSTVPVIAIDGPSGSGKGTVARRVADALGYHLLDSGALYRLTALAAESSGVPLDDGAAVADIARGLAIRFDSHEDGSERIWLAGEDVTLEVRTESTGAGASIVAAIPAVRAALLERKGPSKGRRDWWRMGAIWAPRFFSPRHSRFS